MHCFLLIQLPSKLCRNAIEESTPVRAALANTAVLMSLFVYFMGSGTPTSIIVIMTTAITILQQSAIAGKGAALGLFMGNIVGGFAATVAYLLISLLPAPAFLFLVVFLFALLFAQKLLRVVTWLPFTQSE
jgi:hypothetical protein